MPGIRVATLENLITGDDSNFQAAKQRTEAGLQSLKTQAQASTSVISSSFQSAGASIGPAISAPIQSAVNSINTVGTAAQSSFNSASQASQNAGATISSAMQGVNAAISGVATEASAMGQGVAAGANVAAGALNPLASVGAEAGQAIKTASESAASGLAGLGASAVATGANVGELALQKAQLLGQIKNVEAGIRTEASALASAQSAVAQLGGGHKQLNDAVQQSEQKLAGYITQQTLLKGELGSVNAALKGVTVAQTASGAAQQAATVATNATAQATEKASLGVRLFGDAFGQTTTRINTGRGILQGWDAAIEASVRAFGGLPIAVAVGISILSALATKLLHSKAATDDAAKSTKDAAATYIALANAQSQAANAAQGVAANANASFQSLSNLAVGSGNLVVALQSIAKHQSTISEETANLDDAYAHLTGTGERWVRVAQNETISYMQLQANASDLRDEIVDSTNAINKETEAMGPAIATVKAMQAITGATTQETLQWAQSSRLISDDALPAVKAALESNMASLRSFVGHLADSTNRMFDMERAALSLRLALVNIKAPTFDITGTEQGIKNAFETAKNAVSTSREQLKDWGDQLAANRKSLEPVIANITEYAKIHSKGATETARNSDATRIYNQKLNELNRGVLGLGDGSTEAALQVRQLAEAQKVSVNQTERHGGAAKVAHAAVSQYKDGVVGLSNAIDLVTKSLASGAFDRLFDEVPKKARAGVAELKKAAEEVAKSFTDLLKLRTDEGVFRFNDEPIKITVAGLKVLGVEGVQQLKNVDLAVKEVRNAMDLLGIAALKLDKPVIEINEHQGALVDSTFHLTKAYRDLEEKANKLHVALKIILPASKEINFSFDEITGHISETGKATQQWSNNFGRALDDGVRAANAAAPSLKLSLKAIKDAIESSFAFDEVKIANEVSDAVRSVITEFEKQGELLNETSEQIQKRVLDGLHSVFGPQWTGEFKKIGEQTLRQWSDDLNRLPGALDSVVNKMLTSLGILDTKARQQFKGTIGGILDIAGALPGKLGEVLKKGADAFTSWVNRIDTILKGLHKIFQSIPDGLGEMLSKVTGIFKGAQSGGQGSIFDDLFGAIKNISGEFASNTQNVMADISDSMKFASKESQDSFNAIGSASASASASVGSAASSIIGSVGGIATAITGLAALYTSTFTSKSAVVRGVGGGASFGLIGALTSIFFGGPSKEEKELAKAQMAAQLQQAKDAIALSKETVKQAIAATSSALADLMAKVSEGVHVPKSVMKQFAADAAFLLSQISDALNSVAKKATPELKAAAENFSSVVSLAASIPAAFDAINGHWGIAESQFVIFFRDYDRLIDGLVASAEEHTKKSFRKTGKLADLIAPAVNLITPLTEGIKNIIGLKEPSDDELGVIDRVIDKIVVHLGALGQKFEKYYLKTLQFFADKAQSSLELWGKAIEIIRASIDVPKPTEQDAENVVGGLELFINVLIARLGNMATEGLEKVGAIAAAISPISTALKDWAESSSVIRGYTAIAADVWTNIVTDFEKGLTFLDLLTLDARLFVDKSKTIDDLIKEGVGHLTSAMQGYGGGVVGLSSVLQGTIGQLQGGVPEGAGGGLSGSFAASSFGGGSFAPSSGNFASSFAAPVSNAAQSSTPSGPINVHIHVPPGGDGYAQGRAAAQGFVDWARENRGRARGNRSNNEAAFKIIEFALGS
jgi:hypothetical protein